MSLTIVNKLEFIDAFNTAAIAYYLKGDWRNVFKHYAQFEKGQLKRRYLYWSTETDAHFERVLEIFYNEH